jgi:hypothetical protein
MNSVHANDEPDWTNYLHHLIADGHVGTVRNQWKINIVKVSQLRGNNV